jgi:hypothetical protein
LDTFESIGGHHVPPSPEPTPGVPRQYLLDGHQRLSTLFGALVPRTQNLKVEFDSRDAGGEVDWNIFYELQEEDFLIQGHRQRESTWIPTSILLDSIALLKFQRGLSKVSNSDVLIDRSDHLANAFRNYKIPLVPIVTDNLEDATKAFQRINSSGTQMSDVHMVTALTYHEGFDLAEQFRAKLGLKISNPDAEQTSRAVNRDPNLVNEATKNIISAAQFLSEHCSVPSPQFTPYSYQIVLLAEAFRENQHPDQDVCDALKRWLWRTTYTGYFLGARDRDVNSALEDIRSLARDGTHSRVLSPREPVECLPKRYDFRSARGKAIIFRLAELGPKQEDATPINVRSAFLELGPNVMSQFIKPDKRNNFDTAGPENRFISPPTIRPQLFHLMSLPIAEYIYDVPVLESHAIPQEAFRALSAGDKAEFLKSRRRRLVELEREYVESIGLTYTTEIT